jgi:hypothetical protein
MAGPESAALRAADSVPGQVLSADLEERREGDHPIVLEAV